MPTRPLLAERLALAGAMQRDGFRLVRERLRREHPDSSEREIEQLFEAWLLDRPLDAPGRPIAWPRRNRRRRA